MTRPGSGPGSPGIDDGTPHRKAIEAVGVCGTQIGWHTVLPFYKGVIELLSELANILSTVPGDQTSAISQPSVSVTAYSPLSSSSVH